MLDYSNQYQSHQRGPRQNGFTLVELMIASALGLIVLGAVIAIFLSSKRTYSATETVSRMQESARYANQFIAREIRMAGYSPAYEQGTLNKATLFPASGSFGAGVVILGADDITASGFQSGTDSLTLRYFGNTYGNVSDCQGNAVSSTASSTMTLYLSNNNELVCQVGSAAAVVLVDGISDLQFTYGVDTNADRYADTYVTAGAVTDWMRVASIRVALNVFGSNVLSVAQRPMVLVVAVRNQLP